MQHCSIIRSCCMSVHCSIIRSCCMSVARPRRTISVRRSVRARLIRALRLDLGLEADSIKIITFLPLLSSCPLKCERCCIFQKPLPAAVAALFNHSILLHERCATATHHLRAK
ncbi:unnamed protein product [Prorocentrum cordatum]|uniref:Secreted protein n=1 Tax=Prorocentrum cordatum TaxID=2364126 RepID=A0ABN9QPJ3_9DINO|nr:unnamed protein product [Polarella glacialis]